MKWWERSGEVTESRTPVWICMVMPDGRPNNDYASYWANGNEYKNLGDGLVVKKWPV